MSIIDTLITDRTGGCYNATDLNRVGEAMGYIAGLLQACGYAVSVSPRTDWTVYDFPAPSDWDAIMADLATLRAVLAVSQSTPAVPPVGSQQDYLTVADANDIEKILVDIDDALRRLSLSLFYTGEIYCGEG